MVTYLSGNAIALELSYQTTLARNRTEMWEKKSSKWSLKISTRWFEVWKKPYNISSVLKKIIVSKHIISSTLGPNYYFKQTLHDFTFHTLS